jgi:methionyl-tRNA formyltransferase
MKIRITYAGYHIETLLLLYGDERFAVAGTGLIEELLSSSTLNPVNHLFKLIYRLRVRNRFRLLERILLSIWKRTSRLATSFYYRYSDYLIALSEFRTVVVDMSNTQEAIDHLSSNRIDVLVVCTWSILPEEIITSPTYGSVNIHPSKLPQYRGALPTLWSLKNGDRESAVTYQIMDKAIDVGSIIGQHTFPIGEGDDWYSLEVKLNEILQTTLLSNLIEYINGETKPAAQDVRMKSTTGKYYEYMKIDWDKEDAKEVYNKINSYPFIVPNDFCYTVFNGKKIAVKNAAISKSKIDFSHTGQFHVQGFTLLIQAKRGIIACRLFSGLGVKDSILFILRRNGLFA